MTISKDVLHLIFLTEKIEADMLGGQTLSPEEAILVRQCASQLLNAIPELSQPLCVPQLTLIDLLS